MSSESKAHCDIHTQHDPDCMACGAVELASRLSKPHGYKLDVTQTYESYDDVDREYIASEDSEHLTDHKGDCWFECESCGCKINVTVKPNVDVESALVDMMNAYDISQLASDSSALGKARRTLLALGYLHNATHNQWYKPDPISPVVKS